MASNKETAVFEMEMESLVHETLGNGSERGGGPPPPPPPENPWRKRGLVLLIVAVGLLVWHTHRTDVNTVVTDVDKLPSVPEAELPSDKDDLEGADVNVPPMKVVPQPVEQPVDVPVETPVEVPAEGPVEVPVDVPVETPVEAPIADSDANATAPDDNITPAQVPAPQQAPEGPAPPIPPAPELAPLQTLQPEESGYKRPPDYFSDTYLRRACKDRQSPNPALTKSWGQWSFVDPKASSRPNLEGLYRQYPNRDVPYTAFPPNAWQKDPAYLKDFLEQGIALSERALGAILAEWGHYDPKKDKLEDAMQDAEKAHPAFMFNLSVLGPKLKKYPKNSPGNAGWTSETALARIRRKLLHAIITQGSFRISMGGHSSSAGHGNHFQQSYTMQIQRALEPVLARLGVYHFTRNMGMGGLGTAHNGLASPSFYGGDNDILMWDSSMTEKDIKVIDMFVRQGLLGGEKVPVLWGLQASCRYDDLVQSGCVSTGMWGTGMSGVPKTESLETLESIPYATRFVDCAKEVQRECRTLGYNGVCWINRTDVTPSTPQQKTMGGRAKWHPGNNFHLLKSRFTVYNVIKVLREALIDWSKMDNYILQDEEWHMTEENERIRDGVSSATDTTCFNLGLPDIVCSGNMQGRSEYTPKANPQVTSLRSILLPEVEMPKPLPNFYDPPDTYNPALDPPDESDVDYLAIVENGNDFLPMYARHEYLLSQLQPPNVQAQAPRSSLPAGKGWTSAVTAAADNCDGSYTSFCARGANSNCLLYAHNDYRGGLVGDGLSGWLLMSLKDVRHGLILVLATEMGAHGNKGTLGWKCENNEASCANPISDEEANSEKPSGKKDPVCQDYSVEFAVDGKVTTLKAEEFHGQTIEIERLIQISVVLNNTDFVPEGQSKDVELGIRMTGNCGRSTGLKVSFVYWA